MARLEGKVCIVTGGTSGIGRRTAEVFAAEGAHVVIAGRLTEDMADGYRPDIGRAFPGVGNNRGWGAGFSNLPEGTHRMCVTVINQGEGVNKLLGCRDVVVK